MKYVNFNQLRSFYAVAQETSFTAAAKLLNVGQPTITTQVRSLEEEYGVELFHRLPRGIELTETGRALFAIVQRLFRLEEEAVDLLSAARGLVTGHLRVGAVGPFFVMKLLSSFSEKYPLIQVSLKTGNSGSVLQDLLEFGIDVAVLGQISDDPRLATLRLSRQSVILFVNRDHAWSRRTNVHLRELDGQRIILREPGSLTRRVFEDALAAAEVRPKIVMEVSRDAVREAVAEGLGIGIMSEAEITPDERFRPLGILGADVYTEAYAVCLRSRKDARMVRAFMALAEQSTDRLYAPLAEVRGE